MTGMVDVIIAGAVVLVVIAGFWFTRSAKGPGGPPRSAGERALTDLEVKRLAHDEAFEDNKPEDY